MYGGAGECERQLEQLCKQTTQLLRAGKGRASCEVASECMVVCQKVNEGPKLGRQSEPDRFDYNIAPN